MKQTDALEIASEDGDVVARLCANCGQDPHDMLRTDVAHWLQAGDRTFDWTCDGCGIKVSRSSKDIVADPYFRMGNALLQRHSRPIIEGEHETLAWFRIHEPEYAEEIDCWLEKYAGGYSWVAVDFWLAAVRLVDPSDHPAVIVFFTNYVGEIWRRYPDMVDSMVALEANLETLQVLLDAEEAR